MIADLQSERMDEQRAQLPGLVSRRVQPAATAAAAVLPNVSQNHKIPEPPLHSDLHRNSIHAALLSLRVAQTSSMDDAFLDMLIRCQVKCALNVQCVVGVVVSHECTRFACIRVRDSTQLTHRV